MQKLPDSQERNRRGCFILVAAIALALVLIAWLGFSADPRNKAAEDIPVQTAG
jgi:hypothetical protein